MSRDRVSAEELRQKFPYEELGTKVVREVQSRAFDAIAKHGPNVLLSIPTGEGKSAVGIAALRAHGAKRTGPLFYVTPNKALVEQVCRTFPETFQMFGRAEYECLYYTEREKPGITAQESPCYMLKCRNRVDQETGETAEAGAPPCPYFQAKYEARMRARRGEIVVCTTAFYLKNRLMVSGWRDEEPTLTVLDEAHGVAEIARRIFEYQITDLHLGRSVELLKSLGFPQAKELRQFRVAFMRLARKKMAGRPQILSEEEITSLIGYLEQIDTDRFERWVRDAIDSGRIDPLTQHRELKLLEDLARNIPRFISSLRYSVKDEERQPLNYVVAFYRKEEGEEEKNPNRARYYLGIKSYYVAPIIRKAFGKQLVAYSATIGDPDVFSFESGLRLAYESFDSSFPSGNGRIYLPADARNLSLKARRRDDLKKTLREIATSAKEFARKGHRSLVLVISEEERQKFLKYAGEAGVSVMTYGGERGYKAKEAARLFVGGEGDILLGTVAQYGEGIDLPNGIAPVIFFLRPGYSRPDDPETQFETRRFSEGRRWALWNWRVMIEALQVRGRNQRTAQDIGICFFMSAQFGRFLYPALPTWLRGGYRSSLKMKDAVADAMKVLK